MANSLNNTGPLAEKKDSVLQKTEAGRPGRPQPKNLFEKDKRSALEAQSLAQWIAFGPVIFQVARVLRNNGMLKAIDESNEGLTLEETVQSTGVSTYGARVLLESALGMGMVTLNAAGRYMLAKTGHFILHDALTKINMDFVHDVCYKGLFDLDKSIETGKPEGLKSLGDWDTIYEGLSQLPPHIQKSWFAFDHFFSDNAFPLVLKYVYTGGIKKLLDIGGNTGKWAIASTGYQDDIKITIMDLPGQLEMAKLKIKQLGLSHRVDFHPANILDERQVFPKGYDAIWMSQFLDCFSETEIISILRRCYDALDNDQYVLILEAFWDKQRFETAAFCLQQTSIYFTALANGNSQMYDSKVFIQCVLDAGFEIAEQIDGIGLSHTLLKCRKKK